MRIAKLTMLFILFSTFISCNQQELKNEQEANANLNESNVQKDSVINEMLGDFNAIRENLRLIKSKQSDIGLKARREGEPEDVRADIQQDVNRIGLLMRENQELIDNLNKRLQSSGVQMKELKKLIDGLTADIKAKNEQITQLKDLLSQKELKLGLLYFKLDSINLSSAYKDRELKEKVDEINKGYFAYGTYKELRDQKVITKEGGFLGIGKTEKLRDNFNKEYFSEIDIRKQKSFLIYAKKAEIITSHPDSSYKFMGKDNKIDSLVISNPEAFWAASKYLVIVIE